MIKTIYISIVIAIILFYWIKAIISNYKVKNNSRFEDAYNYFLQQDDNQSVLTDKNNIYTSRLKDEYLERSKRPNESEEDFLRRVFGSDNYDRLVKQTEELNEKYKGHQAYIVNVVGAWYRTKRAQDVYMHLAPSEPISLKPEPDNIYDNFAVKVMSNRFHIGYVPKEDSKNITEMINSGKIAGSFVYENGDYGLEPEGMKIVIYLKNNEPK